MGDTPYAGGRWSEARFKSFLRSNLRKAWVKWPPRSDCLEHARRESQSDNKRLKWEYECAICHTWHKGSEVQVDHIHECGNINSLLAFVATLFSEEDNLRVVCKGCHQVKTSVTRKESKS